LFDTIGHLQKPRQVFLLISEEDLFGNSVENFPESYKR